MVAVETGSREDGEAPVTGVAAVAMVVAMVVATVGATVEVAVMATSRDHSDSETPHLY